MGDQSRAESRKQTQPRPRHCRNLYNDEPARWALALSCLANLIQKIFVIEKTMAALLTAAAGPYNKK